MRKRYIVMSILALIAIVMLSGCMESSVAIGKNEVLLSMNLSNIFNKNIVSNNIKGKSICKDTDSSAEYYIEYEAITKDNQIHYLAVESTDVSLTLKRGEIYVIGVAHKGSDGIRTIGFIGESDLGITCIPVSEDASSVIDFGKLIEKDVDGKIILNPDVSSDKFASMLGYSKDLLQVIGRADVTFKNMFNPDINRNGVFDKDENLRWHITAAYDFNYNNNEEPTKNSLQYVLWMNTDYPQNAYGEGFWVNANGTTFNHRTDIATLTNLDNGKHTRPTWVCVEMSTDYQWYFNSEGDGNYRLDVKGKDTNKTYSFYFDNLKFFRPDKDFEGLVYPYYQSTAYSDGKVKSISWHWYIMTQEGKEDVSSDIVKMLSDKLNGVDMYFYFSNKDQFDNCIDEYDSFTLFIPQNHDIDIYQNQNVSLEDKDLWVQTNPWDVASGRGDYRMIGENDLAFHYNYHYLNKPSNFSTDSVAATVTKDNIVGKWYNLKYHSENYSLNIDDFIINRNNLSFPSNKPAYIEINGNGTFSAYWEFNNKDYSLYATGTYEVLDGSVIKLAESEQYGGKVFYLYTRIHDGYFESMYSTNNSHSSINRDSSDYMIYSKFK